jgi:hypothetical protein
MGTNESSGMLAMAASTAPLRAMAKENVHKSHSAVDITSSTAGTSAVGLSRYVHPVTSGGRDQR